MKSLALAVVAVLLALGGCNRGVENKEAVRQAIVDHLAKRAGLDVNAMQIDVVAVSFRQNEAGATVAFRPKGAQGVPGMTMNYTLERQGNRWVVKARSDSGASPHGAGGEMSGEMPLGHPPMATPPPSESGK